MNLKEVSDLFREKAGKYNQEITNNEKEIKFYEKVIKDLENKHLSLPAQKLLYEKYRLKLTKDNLEVMLNTIKTDLFVLKEKLKITQEKYKLCCFAVHALGYKQVALPFLIDFMNAELRKSKVSEVELIKINEKIKIHNANVRHNERNAILGADLHLIIDMLNQGYEEIEVIENKNAEKLDAIIEKLNMVIDKDDLASINDNFNLEEMYGNVYEIKDFKYIYTEILRHIQTKIYELINLLKQEEYYFDIETLKIIKEEYKNFYNKYMFIRERIDALNVEIAMQEDMALEDESRLEEIPEENAIDSYKLYYASNSDDPTRCFFMRDLSSIREESLPRIWQLLTSFKAKEKITIKHLGVSNYLEIKDDQIRIILKPLNGENYSVEGVFIKKSDNLKEAYQNMFKRPIAEINDEYSQAVEEQLTKFVEEKGRKGTR